jgi:hypothetical protein
LATKAARLNLDAGRVLFLGLHFEAAFAYLAASTVDPREIIAMFPDVQFSVDGVNAAAAAAAASAANHSASPGLLDGSANQTTSLQVCIAMFTSPPR